MHYLLSGMHYFLLSLKFKEQVDFFLELLLHLYIRCILFQPMILRIKHSLNIIIMLLWRSLSEHFCIVVEVIWIYLCQKPCLLHQNLLKKCETWGTYPVHERTSRPLVREWKMEKLKHREKCSKSVYKPMLIILIYSSLK